METAITHIEPTTRPPLSPSMPSPGTDPASLALQGVEPALRPCLSGTDTARRVYVICATNLRLPLRDIVRERLDQLWREGKIAWSGRPFRPTYPKARARGGNVADLLIADRG